MKEVPPLPSSVMLAVWVPSVTVSVPPELVALWKFGVGLDGSKIDVGKVDGVVCRHAGDRAVEGRGVVEQSD
jgi:hypothetical protein